MAKSTQVREIRIRVDDKTGAGLKKVSNRLGAVQKNTRRTANAVTRLNAAFRNVVGFTFIGLGIQAVVRAIDEIQLLTDRISVFAGGTQEALETLDKLEGVANRTGTSIAAISSSYSRLALSLDDAGVSGDALLETTLALQQSFRLSGSSIGEARAAIIQLTQGFASGQLRGQELRSVLEANAVIGGILADKLNITRGELIQFGETQGGISSAIVLEALAESFDELNEKGDKLSLTLEQSLAVALNKVVLNINKFNKDLGFSEGVASVTQSAVENLSLIVSGLATIIAISLIPSLANAITSLGVFTASLLTTTAAGLPLVAFLPILAAELAAVVIPITILLGIIGSLVFAIVDTEGALQALKKGLNTVGVETDSANEKSKRFFDTLLESATNPIYAFALRNVARFVNAITGALEEVEDTADKVLNGEALRKAAQEITERLGEGELVLLSELNIALRGNAITLEQYRKELVRFNIAQAETNFIRSKTTADAKELAVLDAELKVTTAALEVDTRKLNKAYSQGTVGLQEYNERIRQLEIEKLSAEVRAGTTSQLQFNRAVNELEIQKLNQQIAQGAISWSEYNTQTRELQRQNLNSEFKEGTVSLKEYDDKLVSISEKFEPDSALRKGTRDYIQSAGTISENVAAAIARTFSTLEDTFVEFTKTGRLNFAKFTEAILDDLNRIIIRQAIIRPLAQGVLGAFSPGPTTIDGGTIDIRAAKGAAFDSNGVTAFAKGGIVNQATMFGFGNNQTGLMGEKGPEAVVPLKRTSQGELGVQATPPNVNINVINNSESEVEVRESSDDSGERQFDVLIVNKVKDAIASGQFDRQFGEQYNLRRRGF